MFVKVEGPFTEWYAVAELPYLADDEFRAWYDDHDFDLPPWILVPVGEDDYITTDLDCLCERMDDFDASEDDVREAVEMALAGNATTIGNVTATPFSELPHTPRERFEDYGPYAEMMENWVKGLK